MKQLILSFIFAFVALSASSQTPTYTELIEQNTTMIGATKHIEAGGTLWYITDNNYPNDIRTYVFYQRPANVPNIPNVPAGWSAYEATYDQSNDIPFDFTGPVTYILTEDHAVYIKIN